MSILSAIFEAILEVINSKEVLEMSRLKPTFFTRERKLTFRKVIMHILDLPKETAKLSLNRFANNIGDTPVSQQAFSSARNKINHLPFLETFKASRGAFPRDKRWKGYLLNAIDGSALSLPKAPALTEYFGAIGPKNAPSPAARSSVRFDMLNNVILDADITPFTVGERVTATEFLNRQERLENQINIYDRGYFSWEFAEEHIKNDIRFLFRVKRKFNNVIDSLPSGDHTQTLCGVRVRIIKLLLPSGEIETLVTDIFDESLHEEDFRELYSKRWEVETAYDILKNKICVEIFTGLSPNTIMQDYFAMLTVLNMVLGAKRDADKKAAESRSHKDNKYEYAANVGFIVGTMKDRMIEAFICTDGNKRSEIMSTIIKDCASCVVPIRPGRSFPRKKPRAVKFHQNKRFDA